MEIEGMNDSTSYEFYETFNEDENKYNIVPYEMCSNITCIFHCRQNCHQNKFDIL